MPVLRFVFSEGKYRNLPIKSAKLHQNMLIETETTTPNDNIYFAPIVIVS